MMKNALLAAAGVADWAILTMLVIGSSEIRWSGVLLGGLVALGVLFLLFWRATEWAREATEKAAMRAFATAITSHNNDDRAHASTFQDVIASHNIDDGAHGVRFDMVRAIALTAKAETVEFMVDRIGKHNTDPGAHLEALKQHPTREDFAGFSKRLDTQMDAIQAQIIEMNTQRREEVRDIKQIMAEDRKQWREEQAESKKDLQGMMAEFKTNVVAAITNLNRGAH
jgi:hypothetical protein